MTGEEKAGLLLLSLNPRVAEAVLNRLGPQAKARLTGHMQKLESSPQREEMVQQVLGEAEKVLRKLTLKLVRTDEPTLAAAPLSAPKPTTDRVLGDDSPPTTLRIAPVGTYAPAEARGAASEQRRDSDPMAALNRVANQRLMLALDSENPRTIALILNCLGEDKAGAIFKELEPAIRCEVSVQMGTSAMPAGEIVQRTVRAMLAKEQALPEVSADAKGNSRFKKTAELLRKLERQDRGDALAALEQRDPAAASQVREFLYLFEDILCLDGRSLQKLLGELDGKILAMAMKGASQDIMAKIVANMSKRAVEGLTEEMEFLAAASPAQIRQAQKAIADVIQKLDQAGQLVMMLG